VKDRFGSKAEIQNETLAAYGLRKASAEARGIGGARLAREREALKARVARSHAMFERADAFAASWSATSTLHAVMVRELGADYAPICRHALEQNLGCA